MIKMPNAMRAVQMNAAAPSAHAAGSPIFMSAPTRCPLPNDRFAGSILSENVGFQPRFRFVTALICFLMSVGARGTKGYVGRKAACVCVCVLTGRIATPTMAGL
jgi:hypothetical protein